MPSFKKSLIVEQFRRNYLKHGFMLNLEYVVGIPNFIFVVLHVEHLGSY